MVRSADISHIKAAIRYVLLTRRGVDAVRMALTACIERNVLTFAPRSAPKPPESRLHACTAELALVAFQHNDAQCRKHLSRPRISECSFMLPPKHPKLRNFFQPDRNTSKATFCHALTSTYVCACECVYIVSLVRQRSVPTEPPPHFGDIGAHFRVSRVPRGQRDGSLRPYSRLSRPESLLFLASSSSVVLARLSGLTGCKLE
jgi:hypothetical protein